MRGHARTVVAVAGLCAVVLLAFGVAGAAASPPTNVTPPSVSGDFTAAGNVLTADFGTWSDGSFGGSFWYQCDANGFSCAPITGTADTNQYTTQAGDLGHVIEIQVQWENADGIGIAPAQTQYAIGAPETQTSPQLSGSLTTGSQLSVTDGTWTGTPTITYQWLRCQSGPNDCLPIPSETASTYTASALDIDHVLEVDVTATNANGASVSKVQTAAVITGPPGIVSGTPNIVAPSPIVVGSTLFFQTGTWAGGTSFSLQWQRCDTNDANCSPIAGETSSSYVVQAADVNHDVEADITESNTYGQTTASAFVAVADLRPVLQDGGDPVIGGDPAGVGSSLIVTQGTWSNTPTSFAYQWERCDAAGANCTPIDGATSFLYTVVADDLGHDLVAQVTATNSDGDSSPALSDTVGPVGLPQNLVAPTISGDPAIVGGVLTVDNGFWNRSPTSYGYQWRRCDNTGNGCSDIGGATAATYTIVAGDLGHVLEADVIATNAAGSSKASVDSPVIGTPAVAGFDGPSIGGDSSAAGNVLTVDPGTWDGSPTFTYQWNQCDSVGLNCVPIGGATNATYTLQAGDLGHVLSATVTGTNGFGAGIATAFLRQPAGAPAIVGFGYPVISGDLSTVGSVLSMSTGTWSGSPTFSYQWKRCDANGFGCVDIGGATSSDYTTTADDVGHVLQATITATNANGSSTWTDATLSAIGVPAILGGANPVISGDLSTVGNVLTVSTGTWSGSPTFTYQWSRCTDAVGLTCTALGGATASTYTIQLADAGDYLKATVTGTNASGAGSATALTSSVVGVPQIVGFGFPSITGDTSAAGKVLTVSTGTWSGSPTFTYQWSRCDSAGDNCTDIPGATASTYTTQHADLGHFLQATVTATSGALSASAAAQTLDAIGAPQVAGFGYPTISGDLTTVGGVLTVDHGTWTGSPTFTYQWSRCTDPFGFTCAPIGGATASTYTIQDADLGHVLQVAVTGTNANGATTVSSVTEYAAGAPEISGGDFPVITGDTSTVGNVLTVTDGTWTGSPTLTYQWERCNTFGSACTPIGGATADAYTTVDADAGHALEAVVTATNANGSTTESATTDFAIGSPTIVGAYPTITGNWSAAGGVLTATPGEWSGNPQISYQWLRCSTFFICTVIGGATSGTHTLTGPDIGDIIEADVTASNGIGSSSEGSFVLAGSPSPAGLPQITGNIAHVGNVLTVSNGTWNGRPTTFTRQWLRCNASGFDCVPITGATGTTYTIAAADVGKTLFVEVTAKNAVGETFAESLVTGIVGTGAAQHLLTVSTTGSGIVTSDTGGIDCGGTCSAEYTDGTTVTLTAAPTAGWAFSGWSGGGCSGTGTCPVTVGADTTVHATFTAVPGPPTVTSFTPTGAGAHETVTVTGTNFTGATRVTLNGTPVAFTVVSATTLTFTVPAGATSGPVAVTTVAGTGTSAFDLTVLPPPAITSIGPGSGPVGTLVTITGTDLDSVVGVEIGHIVVVPTSVSSTEVTFVVPPGATSGTITVISPAGSATSAGTFTVTP